MTEQLSEKQKGLLMLKEAYDDKCITINGRDYELTNTTHATRLSVFAFYSQFSQRDFATHAYLRDPGWSDIEKKMFSYVTFEKMTLDKAGHFDKPEYEKDYLLLCVTLMGVFSYPFLPESVIS